MPNHCESDLRIDGQAKDVAAFVQFARGPHGTQPDFTSEVDAISCNRFIPMPKELQQNKCLRCGTLSDPKQGEQEAFSHPRCPKCGGETRDGYNRGGYDWCCDNWGTKWGLYDISIKRRPKPTGRTGVSYSFTSAWAPPKPVVLEMARRFPTLVFDLKYYERGMPFKGHLRVEKGRVVLDEQDSDYNGSRGG